MRAKIFVNVFANVVLVAVVASLAVLTVGGATVGVFKSRDTSPVYRGQSNDGVSLMVNVYQGTEYIDGFLEIFDKYNAHATFFVGGSWAVEHFDTLQKIVEHGHEIGNHGYFHKQHSKLEYQQNVDEIEKCGKVVWQLTGIQMTLFAPPSGDFDSTTLSAADKLGYKTIMWSKDTIDWRDKSEELVYKRATKNISCGDLILMHPTKHTLQALEKIVQYYISNNIRLISVGENIGQNIQ